MARGELMKKLLASYGRDEDFRTVAEQIIAEEEHKHNRVLARSLRRVLDESLTRPPAKKNGLSYLSAPDNDGNKLVERREPTRTHKDIVLSSENTNALLGLAREFRQSDKIRKHGLPVRSKLLFCGPPGCGKTLCAEVFAGELGLPLYEVKLDQVISSYLGETASNLRTVFEIAQRKPCVLFLDEFDALAKSREDGAEHGEIRRVVNNLLLFIDQLTPKGFLIAASNLDSSLDDAIWRRFDEVLWFDRPDAAQLRRFVTLRFKNVHTDFRPTHFIDELIGYSYAELERICIGAIKIAVIQNRKLVLEDDFTASLENEKRRTNRATSPLKGD